MSETVPEFGGCPWPVDPACFSDDWETMEESVRDRSLALASATLTRLTGGRVGNCPIKVRPYAQTGACFIPGYEQAWLYPGVNVAGQWVNNCGVTCTDLVHAVKLPAPIGRVDEVKIDGVVVDESDYWVMGGNRLFLDASITLPLAQDVNLPDTEVGTWSVTYLNAYPVDSVGAYAAGVLAMEFARACTGGKCRLPTGVTQITRQGVSMNIVTGAFPNGEVGIREVDTFIALWNPKHLTQGAKVWSPDMPKVMW